ncbi:MULTISPECIES: hypothetical protein [unclassified Synechococcus]|uniref:hypothetical protein n=1 Tax=unclassified Synechococcus TaxID=2626047 RepID=UPI00032111D7|nr:hypothetical protein [Synechococcus sp. RS9917]
MSAQQPPRSNQRRRSAHCPHLQSVPNQDATPVLELLAPGTFVTLDNHPKDLPPFQVIHCRGGRCWVRQQAWGHHVQWEVEHNRLTSA